MDGVFSSFMRFRFGFQEANHTRQSSTCSPEILVYSRVLLVTRIKPLSAAFEAICKMSNPNSLIRGDFIHQTLPMFRVECGSVHRVHEAIHLTLGWVARFSGSARNEVLVSEIGDVMGSRMSSGSVANHTGPRILESPLKHCDSAQRATTGQPGATPQVFRQHCVLP